jgi:TolB-like protein/Tfp pilus assembly protein PilF
MGDVQTHPRNALSQDLIEAQLARILASSQFSGAGRLSSFLEFVVRKTLGGHSGQIKEYTVGTEVFGRPENFDPRLDTIVRVQAGNLRRRLVDYYANGGASDRVVIELPRGSYVPSIHARDLPPAVEESSPLPEHAASVSARSGIRPIWTGIGVASIILVGLAVYWAFKGARSDEFTSQPGIAVLPFTNLSENRADEYFSDGLTEEIIGALSRIERLRVPGHSSSSLFKSPQQDIHEIGRKLGVGWVLEGGARIAGDRVRVNARLVQVKDGYLLWSQNYERPLRDLFAVQENISRSIVNALRIQLSGPAARSLVRPQPRNLEAYSLYLKGRFQSHAGAGEWEHDRTPAEYFSRAIEKDPSSGLAYAALADWYTAGQARELPNEELLARAKALAEKALRLDHSLADAHNALGNVNMWTWDWRAAEIEFRRAIELNPGYSTAHLNYSRMLTSEARFEEALREADRARELDPMPSAVTLEVGQVHYYARRYDRAMEEFRRILEVTPNSVAARHCIGTVYARQGLYAQAIAQFQSVNPPDLGVEAGNLRALAHTLAIAGRGREATDALNRLTEMSTSLQPNGSGWLDWNLALVYAGLGDKDQAFAHLNNAYEKRERALAEIKVEPLVDNLRTDLRYAALLKKIGLL